MGELSDYLTDRKNRLQTQITQAQNFNVTEAQQKITKINAMLARLATNPGWDV